MVTILVNGDIQGMSNIFFLGTIMHFRSPHVHCVVYTIVPKQYMKYTASCQLYSETLVAITQEMKHLRSWLSVLVTLKMAIQMAYGEGSPVKVIRYVQLGTRVGKRK